MSLWNFFYHWLHQMSFWQLKMHSWMKFFCGKQQRIMTPPDANFNALHMENYVSKMYFSKTALNQYFQEEDGIKSKHFFFTLKTSYITIPNHCNFYMWTSHIKYNDGMIIISIIFLRHDQCNLHTSRLSYGNPPIACATALMKHNYRQIGSKTQLA